MLHVNKKNSLNGYK